MNLHSWLRVVLFHQAIVARRRDARVRGGAGNFWDVKIFTGTAANRNGLTPFALIVRIGRDSFMFVIIHWTSYGVIVTIISFVAVPSPPLLRRTERSVPTCYDLERSIMSLIFVLNLSRSCWFNCIHCASVARLLHTLWFVLHRCTSLTTLLKMSLCVVIRFASFCIEVVLFGLQLNHRFPAEIFSVCRCDWYQFTPQKCDDSNAISQQHLPSGELRRNKTVVIHCI